MVMYGVRLHAMSHFPCCFNELSGLDAAGENRNATKIQLKREKKCFDLSKFPDRMQLALVIVRIVRLHIFLSNLHCSCNFGAFCFVFICEKTRATLSVPVIVVSCYEFPLKKVSFLHRLGILNIDRATLGNRAANYNMNYDSTIATAIKLANE